MRKSSGSAKIAVGLKRRQHFLKSARPAMLSRAVLRRLSEILSDTIFSDEPADVVVLAEKECMTGGHYYQVKRGSIPKTSPVYMEEKKWNQ